MEKSLEASSKWLRQSRLKVNKEKEELWLFFWMMLLQSKYFLVNTLLQLKRK
jgi:hypothetical protein